MIEIEMGGEDEVRGVICFVFRMLALVWFNLF